MPLLCTNHTYKLPPLPLYKMMIVAMPLIIYASLLLPSTAAFFLRHLSYFIHAAGLEAMLYY